jgi:glutathione S-transferase
LAVVLLDIYMKIQVGKARKKYGVRYPDLYAVEGMKKRSGDHMDSGHDDAPGVVAEEDAFMFNCGQRVHQNQCENVPTFLGLLLLAGSAYPLPAGISGFIWVLGRFAFAQGYYTGDPSKRNRGAFAYLGLFALIFMICAFAVNVFQNKKPY